MLAFCYRQLHIYQRCLLFQDDFFIVLKINVMVKVIDFIHQYQHWLCSVSDIKWSCLPKGLNVRVLKTQPTFKASAHSRSWAFIINTKVTFDWYGFSYILLAPNILLSCDLCLYLTEELITQCLCFLLDSYLFLLFSLNFLNFV